MTMGRMCQMVKLNRHRHRWPVVGAWVHLLVSPWWFDSHVILLMLLRQHISMPNSWWRTNQSIYWWWHQRWSAAEIRCRIRTLCCHSCVPNTICWELRCRWHRYYRPMPLGMFPTRQRICVRHIARDQATNQHRWPIAWRVGFQQRLHREVVCGEGGANEEWLEYLEWKTLDYRLLTVRPWSTPWRCWHHHRWHVRCRPWSYRLLHE